MRLHFHALCVVARLSFNRESTIEGCFIPTIIRVCSCARRAVTRDMLHFFLCFQQCNLQLLLALALNTLPVGILK